ncbi:MAG TPA: outer membrane lipoprotein-sorting protein, partial [Rariglobus sp.]
VQNGPKGAVWVAPVGGVTSSPAALDASALFTPLAGTDLTAFDLQMPFLYWSEFVFEGVAPVRGRPAHVFLMYPPDAIAALKPELAGVRVYLDTQFGALVQAQQIGAEERVLKSITVLDIKKVDDQWMVKTIDLRDEATRNKTQFLVTGAALGLDFSDMLFDPSNLSSTVSPPPAARIRRLGP